MRRFATRTRQDAELGASAVEFALLFPIFVMIVIGTINFGIAYERWIASTQGAREGSRFGATLSLTAAGGGPTTPNPWLEQVSTRTIAASELLIDGADPTRAIPGMVACVALKVQPPTATSPTTFQHVIATAGSTGVITRTYASGACPGMTPPSSGDYVQVSIRSPRGISWFLGSTTVTIAGRSTSRFEATEV